jgi:hypothetical protein
MSVKRIVTAIVAGCAAVVISAVPGLAAQTPTAHQHAAAAKAKPAPAMEAKCQAMMAEHEKMMADVKAADQRLDGLVATMTAASGQAKVDATSAAVTEIVAQRTTMRDGMMKMQEGMMAHMMAHMQAGKESMTMCPMMKSMGGMKH